jgi:phage shock protein A
MFNRLRLSLKAKISRRLDRAENPGEILDYSYQRQVEQLHHMRRGVADLVTAKKHVERQRDRHQDQFLKLHNGARKALELGREDIARQALERQQRVGQELIGLNQQVSELERQQAQMVARERDTRAKLERFRSRKEITKAQYAAAKAQLAISEGVAGLSSQLRDAGLSIQRTMDKVEEMNLRADVLEELERAGTLAPIGSGEDDIDRQLRAMSSGGSIDAEISRLRGELNRGPPSTPPA